MSHDINNEIRNMALSLLARRDHSETELITKIRRKHAANDAQVAALLSDLTEQGLLSDLRFAVSYIRSRSGKGFGPQRITLELRSKGVASDIAEQALQEFEEAWGELAKKAWRKKFACPPQQFSERMKQENFLKYRGFRSEDIQPIFE